MSLTSLTPYGTVSESLLERIRNIKILLSDVDGVLSDGKIYISNSGEEMKNFNTKDGFGIVAIQKLGVGFGVITGRESEIVNIRMKSLKARYVYQGITDKVAALMQIINESGVSADEIAYIGDDVIDITVFNHCGMSFCPRDAHPIVKSVSDYICHLDGGNGEVREVCDLILTARGRLDSVGASI